jgi:hypothetical protein
MRFSSEVLVSCVVLLILSQTPAIGSTIFAGSDDQGRAASALFTVTGSDLKVVLTNTSTLDVLIPSDLLSGVYFALPSGVALAPLSATLTTGSTVWYGSDGGGNLGGEWAYATTNNIGGFAGANRGISSAGMGIFGSPNFNGPSLFDPSDSVDGADYNITSAGDNLATGNKKVTGDAPIVQNSVTFHLTIAGSLQESDIGNVVFQYGTVLTDPHIPVPVPEPSMLLMAAVGLVGLTGCVWRRRA